MTCRSKRCQAWVSIVGIAIACHASTPSAPRPGAVSGWPSYGGTAGQRYAAADEITPANVKELAVAWTYRHGDVSDGTAAIRSMTAFEATPILADQTLFFCTPINRVIRDISPVPIPWKLGVPNIGGPLVTAGRLVFIGAAMDDYLRAFDLETGAELWKARLPAGGQATPMSYRLDSGGRQYVVIAAGGHGRGGTRLGDHVVAFTLGGDVRRSPIVTDE